MINKIVCLGDSITFGYEINPSKKWVNLLASELNNIEIINCGINGDTTNGMLSRLSDVIQLHNPTHLIITGGTNDLWFGLKNEQIIANINAIVRYTNQYEIATLIGIPTPIFNLNELNFINENYALRIKNFQKKLIEYCLFKEYYFIDFSEGMDKQHFLEDGLHPNEKGQIVMMNSAKSKLLKLL